MLRERIPTGWVGGTAGVSGGAGRHIVVLRGLLCHPRRFFLSRAIRLTHRPARAAPGPPMPVTMKGKRVALSASA